MKLSEFSHEKEFKYIMKHYLAPLVGIKLTDVSICVQPNPDKRLIQIKNQDLLFFEDITSSNCYRVPVSKNFPIQSLSLLRNVYKGINEIRYRMVGDEIKNKYQDFGHLVHNYEYIVQKKVIHWICGNKPSEGVLRLVEILQEWNTKTYEGRKVPFAFTIDLDSTDGKFEFEDFLQEEYSATFGDGITSIIDLDKNLKFLGYNSITSLTQSVNDFSNTPYRFSQAIKSFTKNKIGVYLLTGGDIILIKNCMIELVKREGKWLNFNKDVFTNVISGNICSDTPDFKEVLNEIYLSSLDVSFSHCGGIIACVAPEVLDQLLCPNGYEYIVKEYKNSKDILNTIPKSLVNYIDNLKVDIKDYAYNLKKYDKIFGNAEMKKRFKKREFLLTVTNNKNFQNLDRKLRTELISMDGATIIDYTGRIVSIGAIIQNDSGSYGGGRGAAAKKLSNFGFAVKISTDGYIEVYIKERVKYNIK